MYIVRNISLLGSVVACAFFMSTVVFSVLSLESFLISVASIAGLAH